MASAKDFLNPRWVEMEITRLLCNIADPQRHWPEPTICVTFSPHNIHVNWLYKPPRGTRRLLIGCAFSWDAYRKTVKRRRPKAWGTLEQELRENYWHPVAKAIADEIAAWKKKGRTPKVKDLCQT